MRNPNGYGSVSYLGKKRRRPYIVRITTGKKYDKKKGKVVYKQTPLGYYATRKEAMLALAKYNESPYDLDAKVLTFSDIYQLWCEHGLDGLSESSCRAYAAAYKHTMPIHNMPIAEIRTDHMQNIIYNINELSASTVQNVIKIFHKVFQYAMQRDIVAKDYSKYIVGKVINEREAIHAPFTSDEIALLWNNLNTEVTCYHRKKPIIQKPADIFLIMIYTGMRPAELMNMENSDVHIEEHYMVGGVKNATSKRRIIPIHDAIIDLIRARMSLNKYLIVYKDTKPDSKQFRQMTDGICEKIHISHLPHDGRHSFATFAKRSRIDEYYIRKIMGHKQQNITNSVYTHVDPDELVAEVNKIKFV